MLWNVRLAFIINEGKIEDKRFPVRSCSFCPPEVRKSLGKGAGKNKKRPPVLALQRNDDGCMMLTASPPEIFVPLS